MSDTIASIWTGNVTDRLTRLLGALTGVNGSSIATAANPVPVGLSTVDAAKVPALGQALAAASTPVVLTALQIAQLAQESGGNLAAILAKFTDAAARFGVLGGDGANIASFSNALPIFGGLLSNHSSATIPATGVQVKASAGSAYSVNYKNDTGFTRYLQIHNTVGQPGAGARSVWSSAALATGTAATLQIGHTLSGGCCSTAVYLVISSSIFSYTAAADTAVQVELLFK